MAARWTSPANSLALAALACASCAAARPSAAPRDEEWIVLAKSCRLPEWMDWYTHFAHHTWLDVKRGSEDAWTRVEVSGRRSGGRSRPLAAEEARADVRWDREVLLHDVIAGPQARRIAERIDTAVQRWGPSYEFRYEAYPGPNSNTFMRELADEIPELDFTFDHNALGKDYGGWVNLGFATSGTGVRLDTWPLGMTVALREGIELHFFQLVFGLQLWPPAVQLPFLPQLP